MIGLELPVRSSCPQTCTSPSHVHLPSAVISGLCHCVWFFVFPFPVFVVVVVLVSYLLLKCLYWSLSYVYVCLAYMYVYVPIVLWMRGG